MSNKIGIIAEDNSDADVIKVILGKYLSQERFQIKRFVGNGCGPIRRKTIGWAKVLWDRGCRFLILAHDLDDKNEKVIRGELESIVIDTNFKKSIVLIPVREIEAWLLSDNEALKIIFGMQRTPRILKRTESIPQPKEYLRNAIWVTAKIRYIPTVHNARIAEKSKLSELRKCKSFLFLDQYIKQHLLP